MHVALLDKSFLPCYVILYNGAVIIFKYETGCVTIYLPTICTDASYEVKTFYCDSFFC